MKNSAVILVLALASLALSGCATSSSETFLLGQVETLGEEKVADRLSSSAQRNAVDGSPYRVYRLRLDRGDIIRIQAESPEFSPRLTLYSPEGDLLGVTGNDAHFAGNQTQLIRQVASGGAHLVVVSGRGHLSLGSFEIRAERLAESGALDFPGEVQGFLYEGKGIHPTTGGPFGAHRFTVTEEGFVEVVLESRDFEPFVSLVSADGETILAERFDDGVRARILARLTPGDYEVWATAGREWRDGRYLLRVGTTEVDASETFELGRRYQGFLSWDRESIPGSERTGHPLAFELDEATVLDVIMRSNDFDSYLVLTDQEGNFITDDDDSGGDLDARISWPLQAGSYLIWATSFSEEETGLFRIETTLRGEITDMVGTTGSRSIEIGDTSRGSLTQANPNYGPRGTRVAYYTIEIEEEMEVQINLRSTEFDAFLVLEDAQGTVILENDDAYFGTTDALITRRLEPGSYRIAVTTYAADMVGSYTLEVDRAAPSGLSI